MIGLKNKIIGLGSGTYTGISFMCNFRCDTNLGIGKAACRQIPCACLTCLEMLKNTWDKDLNDKEQPPYGVNKRYLYWRNFKGYKNWRLVHNITWDRDKNE